MNLFSKRTIKPTADITPDVLAYWRRKYPDAFFEFSENGKVGYFRKLTAKELEREWKIFAKAPVGDAGKYKEAEDFNLKLIELSMLGGDAEILSNQWYRAPLFTTVGEWVINNMKDTFPNLKDI
jgi:hypothetical protein